MSGDVRRHALVDLIDCDFVVVDSRRSLRVFAGYDDDDDDDGGRLADVDVDNEKIGGCRSLAWHRRRRHRRCPSSWSLGVTLTRSWCICRRVHKTDTRDDEVIEVGQPWLLEQQQQQQQP